MNASNPVPGTAPRCNHCAHYFITHDVQFRYGCSAMDFKSQRQPILEVIASSGQPCLYFQARKKNPSRR